jgi:hypothetical protein
MSRFALSTGIAFALGTAIVAAALLIVWRIDPFGNGEGSNLEVAQVGEITHIRATIKMVDVDGVAPAAGFKETWVDSTGAFARTEQGDSDGNVVRVAVRRVNWVRWLDLTEAGDSHFRVKSYPDAVSGWVPTDVGGPLYFRYFFRGDAVEKIGQTKVDGRAAVLVRAPLEIGENPLPIEGVVDEETGWPFEIRLFKRNSAGGFDPAGKWVIKYEHVELLPIESIPHLFEVESVDRDAASYKKMSLTDAQEFTAFPLFYLGDSFDGMGLGTVTESAPELDPTIRQVLFIYVEWAGTPPIRLVRQLKVTITPAPTEAGAHFNPQPGQEVIATPRGEALFTAVPGRIDLLTEGVHVVIQGDKTSSEQILQAARALTMLNSEAVQASSPAP